MRNKDRTFSLPRWTVTRWLADAGPDVPDEIRRALIASLYGTIPIFASGVINSVLVAGIVAARLQQPLFLCWFAIEVALCLARFMVLALSMRRARQGRPTPTDLYLLLSVGWGASVGYGALISLMSGDWVVATLACTSAAAMVGGVCFRNFGAPRLAAVMIALCLGPVSLAAPFTGEAIMIAAFVQLPLYLVSMRMAAYKLNDLLVATMLAEREHEHQARHDLLTGLSNRVGLMQAIDGSGIKSGDGALALLYLDLDGFKAVNDTYGHTAGDRLLKVAAERLKSLLRAGDIAARMGGDEFVVIARGVDRAGAVALGERLIRELGARYALGPGVAAEVGASVGVALVPEHGDSVPMLLDIADAALYQAKLAGKGRCIIAAAGAPRATVTTPPFAPRTS